jgi:glycosyltransferase involved in cell wall biosynthesis
MKLEVNLEFGIPIWRFFYGHEVNIFDIPLEFKYNDKTYTNGIFLIQFAWDVCKLLNGAKKHLFLNENIYSKRNVILCAPDEKTLAILKKHRPRLQSCLANHNAFIDESIYKIDYTCENKYDLVISSAFSRYKNFHLIKDIKNICTTGYCTSDTDVYNILSHISHTDCVNFEGKERIKQNHKWLKPDVICKYYNMSKIGGIFSKAEGACYSSSEYLLCGLPVLSCKCTGGRQIWYDDTNSVLCDDNVSSVNKNFNIIIHRYNKGYYNREKIRENHINLMEVHRDNLTNCILEKMALISKEILPSFEDLKNSIKHYHSNCMGGMTISPSYIRQCSRMTQAYEIFKELNLKFH